MTTPEKTHDWDAYTGPGSLWISHQEARSLRLFLTVLFAGQAIVNTIMSNPDTVQTAWLWAASGFVYFGLYAAELLALGMFNTYKHCCSGYRLRNKAKIASLATTVTMPNYIYSDTDTLNKTMRSSLKRSNKMVSVANAKPQSAQAKIGNLQLAYSTASYHHQV